MTQINHDNALGEDDEFNDQQGMFGKGGANARPAVAPERNGGGAAKLFLIVFGVAFLAIIVWLGWKLFNRNSGDAADTLSVPVQDVAEVPMAGAPVEAAAQVGMAEPVMEVPAAGAPAMAPAGAELEVPGPAPSTGPVAVAPVGGAAAAVPVSAASAVSTPAPTAEGGSAPAASAAANDTTSDAEVAQLREELRTKTARVTELEREVAQLRAGGGRAATPRRPAAPRRVTSAPRKPAAAVSAAPSTTPARAPAAATASAPNNVVLKAVLEGRAWLQLKNGETVTVAPGDDVAGATVTAIDAERGTVRLSNGAVLR